MSRKQAILQNIPKDSESFQPRIMNLDSNS